MALGGPGDEAATEENSIAGGGSSGVRAASPVSVGVDDELSWSRAGNDKTKTDSALKVAKNPLGSNKMNFPGIMHVQADLLNGVRDVGPSES